MERIKASSSSSFAASCCASACASVARRLAARRRRAGRLRGGASSKVDEHRPNAGTEGPTANSPEPCSPRRSCASSSAQMNSSGTVCTSPDATGDSVARSHSHTSSSKPSSSSRSSSSKPPSSPGTAGTLSGTTGTSIARCPPRRSFSSLSPRAYRNKENTAGVSVSRHGHMRTRMKIIELWGIDESLK
jgi:hypothetical protein